jgi:hypothetical protein
MWVAIGAALLAFARSYARTGNRTAAAILGAIGVIAIVAGTFL